MLMVLVTEPIVIKSECNIKNKKNKNKINKMNEISIVSPF